MHMSQLRVEVCTVRESLCYQLHEVNHHRSFGSCIFDIYHFFQKLYVKGFNLKTIHLAYTLLMNHWQCFTFLPFKKFPIARSVPSTCFSVKLWLISLMAFLTSIRVSANFYVGQIKKIKAQIHWQNLFLFAWP